MEWRCRTQLALISGERVPNLCNKGPFALPANNLAAHGNLEYYHLIEPSHDAAAFGTRTGATVKRGQNPPQMTTLAQPSCAL